MSKHNLASNDLDNIEEFFKLEKLYNSQAENLHETFNTLEKRLKCINNGFTHQNINGIIGFYKVAIPKEDSGFYLDTKIQKQTMNELGLFDICWYAVEDSDYYNSDDDSKITYYVCNHMLQNNEFLEKYCENLKNLYEEKIKEKNKIANQMDRNRELSMLKMLTEKYGNFQNYFDKNGNILDDIKEEKEKVLFKGSLNDLYKFSH